jgi:hypothetical protein
MTLTDTQQRCRDALKREAERHNAAQPAAQSQTQAPGIPARTRRPFTNAKLSEADVRAIREARYEKWETLAERYGVCYETIASVKKGNSWKQVSGPRVQPK